MCTSQCSTEYTFKSNLKHTLDHTLECEMKFFWQLSCEFVVYSIMYGIKNRKVHWNHMKFVNEEVYRTL